MTQTIYKSDKMEYPELHPATTASQANVELIERAVADVDDEAAADDLVLLLKLPAFHSITGFGIFSDELDSDGTETIVVSAGILNADGDDLIDDVFLIKEDTVAQAGGLKEADESSGLFLSASTEDRVIALKIDTVAATKKAGKVRAWLRYAWLA